MQDHVAGKVDVYKDSIQSLQMWGLEFATTPRYIKTSFQEPQCFEIESRPKNVPAASYAIDTQRCVVLKLKLHRKLTHFGS